MAAAAQLPAATELRSRSFQFATTQIVDREGNLLWEIIDPTGGRRTIDFPDVETLFRPRRRLTSRQQLPQQLLVVRRLAAFRRDA